MHIRSAISALVWVGLPIWCGDPAIGQLATPAPDSNPLAEWCRTAKLPSSIAICSEPELRWLTVERQHAFDERREKLNPDQRKALLADQNDWVKSYAKACGLPADAPPSLPLVPEIKNCMAEAGRARISYLKAYTAPPSGSAPGTAPSSDSSGDEKAVGDAAFYDCLARLDPSNAAPGSAFWYGRQPLPQAYLDRMERKRQECYAAARDAVTQLRVQAAQRQQAADAEAKRRAAEKAESDQEDKLIEEAYRRCHGKSRAEVSNDDVELCHKARPLAIYRACHGRAPADVSEINKELCGEVSGAALNLILEAHGDPTSPAQWVKADRAAAVVMAKALTDPVPTIARDLVAGLPMKKDWERLSVDAADERKISITLRYRQDASGSENFSLEEHVELGAMYVANQVLSRLMGAGHRPAKERIDVSVSVSQSVKSVTGEPKVRPFGDAFYSSIQDNLTYTPICKNGWLVRTMAGCP
jgi:hypothetical protein